jgi:hypothetical protein
MVWLWQILKRKRGFENRPKKIPFSDVFSFIRAAAA